MEGDWAAVVWAQAGSVEGEVGWVLLEWMCGVMSCGVCGWVLLGRACMLVYNNKIFEFRDLPVILMSAHVRSYVDGRAL